MLGFVLGMQGFTLGLHGFLDTNMLVSASESLTLRVVPNTNGFGSG